MPVRHQKNTNLVDAKPRVKEIRKVQRKGGLTPATDIRAFVTESHQGSEGASPKGGTAMRLPIIVNRRDKLYPRD